MVGIVLVSHSRALASALVSMLRQVASSDVQVAVAAGVGDGREELGTDAVEICEAIQSVYGPGGKDLTAENAKSAKIIRHGSGRVLRMGADFF